MLSHTKFQFLRNDSKIFSLRFLLVVGTMFFLVTGCEEKPEGKIVIDEERAATQVIPVKQGQQYQNTFIDTRAELRNQVKDTNFLNQKFRLPNAEFFNRDAIGLLLNVPGADGIRVYQATNANGEQKFVLVPVDKNGRDIITQLTGKSNAFNIPGVSSAYAQGDGQVVENGQICPPCLIGGN